MNFDSQDIPIFNLDYTFNKAYSEATNDQKRTIPQELQLKINHKKSDPSIKLKYYEKVYILCVCFGFQFFNIICPPDGVGIDDKIFYKLILSSRGKIKNKEVLESMDSANMFILGGVELAKSLDYGSYIQCGIIHNLVKSFSISKNMQNRNGQKKEKNLSELIFFISKYQGRIDNILSRYDLRTPDYNCLIFLYDGEHSIASLQKKGFPAYSKIAGTLRKSIYRMVKRGLLDVRGNIRNRMYRLSMTGIDLVKRIFDEILKGY